MFPLGDQNEPGGRRAPVTLFIIVINVLVFVLLQLPESSQDRQPFTYGFSTIPYPLAQLNEPPHANSASLFTPVWGTATQIFTHSTVRELAAVAGRATVSTVDHDDIATGPVVGSPIVQWLGETTDAIDGFVQSVVLNTPAELTGDALDEILSALLSRHDMLRARLVRGERWSFDIPETGTARWQESDQPLDQCVTLATEGLDPDNGVMLRVVWRR